MEAPPPVLEPWSPIDDPLLSQCPPRRSIRASALVMCYAGGVGALQLYGGYSSLSCVPVSGRPVGSGCHDVLDNTPAYPLSDHMGAPWSVWSVLWRLLLLCPRRSHIPVCGHPVWFWLYIYWSIFRGAAIVRSSLAFAFLMSGDV